jgi:hypothetical protein
VIPTEEPFDDKIAPTKSSVWPDHEGSSFLRVFKRDSVIETESFGRPIDRMEPPSTGRAFNTLRRMVGTASQTPRDSFSEEMDQMRSRCRMINRPPRRSNILKSDCALKSESILGLLSERFGDKKAVY